MKGKRNRMAFNLKASVVLNEKWIYCTVGGSGKKTGENWKNAMDINEWLKTASVGGKCLVGNYHVVDFDSQKK
jgi:hypothetical protein